MRANMSEKKDNGLLDEEVVGQMTCVDLLMSPCADTNIVS